MAKSSNQPIERQFPFVTEAVERDFKKLPEDVQKDFGHVIHEIQLGEQPWSAKALKGFPGASVMELLTDNEDGTFRAMYTVKFAGFIYLLHSFQKKSTSGIATSRSVIEKVRERFGMAEADFHRRTHSPEGGKK